MTVPVAAPASSEEPEEEQRARKQRKSQSILHPLVDPTLRLTRAAVEAQAAARAGEGARLRCEQYARSPHPELYVALSPIAPDFGQLRRGGLCREGDTASLISRTYGKMMIGVPPVQSIVSLV